MAHQLMKSWQLGQLLQQLPGGIQEEVDRMVTAAIQAYVEGEAGGNGSANEKGNKVGKDEIKDCRTITKGRRKEWKSVLTWLSGC